MNQRQQIGFLEEYWLQDGSGTWSYAGHRSVDSTNQAIGSENRMVLILETNIEINRSFSKKRKIKAGTVVRRIVYPLQGREIK